jgi:hypothetical protein
MDPEGAHMCPACGGAGGGPIGRAGGAWDTEDYVCFRCNGLGLVLVMRGEEIPGSRPGVAKAAVPLPGERKRSLGSA